MMVPIRNGWIMVAKRLRLKKTGLVKLRHDVRTCEYEDVHILWDLLKRNQSEVTRSATRSGKRRFSSIVEWAKRAPMLCHHGV